MCVGGGTVGQNENPEICCNAENCISQEKNFRENLESILLTFTASDGKGGRPQCWLAVYALLRSVF